jgi:molybdopterin converting factor small subunit
LHEQLERSDLRPISLYKKVRTREIHEDEVRRFDPEGLSFLNMNTPEDYQGAVDCWRSKKECELEAAPADAISVSVELFGVARMLAKTKAVALSLPRGATLANVFSALAEKLPVLVGRVINSDGLIAGYTCNINGLNFVRIPSARIDSGDKIFILSADAGG